MRSRTAASALAFCFVFASLAGCGRGGGGGAVPRPLAPGGGTSAAAVPDAPVESRPPAAGKGSKDPDDLNGDGHRDLLVPVHVGDTQHDPGHDERIGVVYGSAGGPDSATYTVYGRRDLGLPQPGEYWAGKDSVAAQDVLTADLDGDGFPDFVTTVVGKPTAEGQVTAARTVPYVSWGGPGGPVAGTAATETRLPRSVSALGVRSVVRGDFDGDGHHDLAALACNQSSVVVMYGPFTRSGAPARTDAGLPSADGGDLVADRIDPSGTSRATSLLVHAVSDGEQTGNTLYPARRGSGLSADGRQLRAGNAHAFGDFDGDGQRDAAVGDSGSRNDEPGYETEAPEVDGSLAVYPGQGGQPVTYRLPDDAEDGEGQWIPGDFTGADPDGDGRDGILVATDRGATLIDGNERIPVVRAGPASANGEKTQAEWRHARPADAADFDGDGKDELILNWGPGVQFGRYGKYPTHWWITDGTTARDEQSFSTTGFAPGDA